MHWERFMLLNRKTLVILIMLFGIGFISCPAYTKTQPTTQPDEIPSLIKSLETGKEDDRNESAYKLGLLSPKQNNGTAITALIKATKDPSEQVRINAVSALGKLRAQEAVDVLINAMHDLSEEVILFAAQSLGEIGSPAVTAESELLNLLKNQRSDIRRVAAVALAKIGVGIEQAVPVMMNDLSLSNEWSRGDAAMSLSYMGAAATPAIPALKILLKDSSWNVRQEACRTLRNIGTQEAKDALKDYPESCYSRATITTSLEQKVTMLIEDLNSSNEKFRMSAVHSLGLMGQAAQPAITALKKLLTDQKNTLQQEACSSLRKIGTDEALEAIKDYKGDCRSGYM